MRFTCQNCGQHFETQTISTGQAANCPKCGARVVTAVFEQEGQGRTKPLDPTLTKNGTPSPSAAVTGATAPPPTKGLKHVPDGNYEIGETVARGGMGAILNAKDVSLRRNVAMKVMLDEKGASQDRLYRFIEEAQITGQLEHPGIVPLHELGVDATGKIFYTMKFVKGRTLSDILKKIADGDTETIQEYPLTHLLTIFQKVCDAVAFAHSKHVIHRDLKPENIMVGDYGEVLVMDWGLAKVLKKERESPKGTEAQSKDFVDSVRSNEDSEMLKTMDGSIMGTPGFMSPEQVTGETKKIDEQTDIYALGAILYNILTLRVPVTARNLSELIEKVTSGSIAHPSEFNPRTRINNRQVHADSSRFTLHESFPHLPSERVPESLSAVAMKALSVNADQRYQTVKELQKEIEAYQGGFATMAEDAGAWKQIRLLVLRHRGVFTAITGMLLVLLGAIGIYTHLNTQERVKAEKALANFQDEQKKRQADRKSSAPAMLRSARMFIEQQEWTDAFAAVQTAIDYNPDLAEARLMQVALLSHNGEHGKALKTCQEYASRFPDDQDAAILLNICRNAAEKGIVDLARDHMVPLLSKHGLYKLAAGFMNSEKDRLNIYRAQLDKAWPGSGSNLTFNADGKLALKLINRPDMTDLSPLTGIPLTELGLAGDKNIRNIMPLKGMPLAALDLTATAVTDISPLKDAPLTSLLLGFAPVSDISPLKGMPLTAISLGFTKVADISPLTGMPLEWLSLSQTPVRDLTPLKGIQLWHINISKTKVKDVTVLKDMPLKSVYCDSTGIEDLSFLKNKSLTLLNAEGLNINDISILKGMPLTWLNVGYTKVTDLSPLCGMPLNQLNAEYLNINDISILKGMPLTLLNVGYTKVTDLSPLCGMPLNQLTITGSYVRDLLPLKGMPLRQLSFSPKDISANISVLREMKTLVSMNDLPPDEFWKKYDAGEFNKKQ